MLRCKPPATALPKKYSALDSTGCSRIALRDWDIGSIRVKAIILGDGETIKCSDCSKYILPGCHVVLFFSDLNVLAHAKMCAHCYIEYVKRSLS